MWMNGYVYPQCGISLIKFHKLINRQRREGYTVVPSFISYLPLSFKMSALFGFFFINFFSGLKINGSTFIIIYFKVDHTCQTQEYYYRRQTKLWKGNVFIPVCDSVHRGVEVYTPQADHPLGQTPSLADFPHSQIPPGRHTPSLADTLLGRHPLQRTVRILLECFLVQEICSMRMFLSTKNVLTLLY